MKVKDEKTADDYLAFREEIESGYQNLSTRLRQIAQFALDHPTEMSMETVATIAKKVGVQPSSVIRFAKNFGYSGFSEMQRVHQAYVVQRSANHAERIRRVLEGEVYQAGCNSAELLQTLCTTNILSLESLSKNVDADALHRAIETLATADRIYALGTQKCFAVAAYLTYMLNHIGIKAYLLSGLGGMLAEQTKTITKRDALVAITYLTSPEGAENPEQEATDAVITSVKKLRAKSILITDSLLMPMANKASISIETRDFNAQAFCSITAAMWVSQTIASALSDRSD